MINGLYFLYENLIKNKTINCSWEDFLKSEIWKRKDLRNKNAKKIEIKRNYI